jgi:cytochrome c-type biogenesis protein
MATENAGGFAWLTSPLLGMTAALLAGAISFVSPCVLPLVPAYVYYIAGRSMGDEVAPGRGQVVWLSLWFVLGFSTVFMILGASATALGQSLLSWRYELIILFGLFMLGAARIQAMERYLRFHLDLPGGRPTGSYVLGLAFGFGWILCIGAILTASATSATIGQGVALLAIYSAGLGIPFLIVAAFADRLAGRLRGAVRLGHRLHQGAGVVMIHMGIAMITGQLSALSYWVLDVFPVLGYIGCSMRFDGLSITLSGFRAYEPMYAEA